MFIELQRADSSKIFVNPHHVVCLQPSAPMVTAGPNGNVTTPLTHVNVAYVPNTFVVIGPTEEVAQRIRTACEHMAAASGRAGKERG